MRKLLRCSAGAGDGVMPVGNICGVSGATAMRMFHDVLSAALEMAHVITPPSPNVGVLRSTAQYLAWAAI